MHVHKMYVPIVFHSLKKKQDYRLEEINFLRQNGKSQEEISQIIPDTQKERKDKAISFLSLQANINTLNQKVADLELKMMRVNLDDGGARNEEEEGKGDDEVGGKDNLQDKDEDERNESPKKAKSRSNETYKSNPIRVTDKKSLRRSKDGHAHAADEKVKD